MSSHQQAHLLRRSISLPRINEGRCQILRQLFIDIAGNHQDLLLGPNHKNSLVLEGPSIGSHNCRKEAILIPLILPSRYRSKITSSTMANHGSVTTSQSQLVSHTTARGINTIIFTLRMPIQADFIASTDSIRPIGQSPPLSSAGSQPSTPEGEPLPAHVHRRGYPSRRKDSKTYKAFKAYLKKKWEATKRKMGLKAKGNERIAE